MEKFFVNVEIGSIILYVEDNKVTKIKLSNKIEEEEEETQDNIFTQQIIEYLNGNRKKLDFNVKISGGKVFKKIWDFVKNIPYGQTMTYGEIAKKLDVNPRVVGFAMNKNQLPIYIPCHRVIGKNNIGGFNSDLKWKKYLLELEKNTNWR
ncbi:cysteine methyltransferase [Thermosipho sp. 1063]|uniref:methylated-DNA--[protein]-cysteine S-methyltransferase n=1 Tax=unclassified Thermosipho (in: thermotogales) TaxID=2676525 RepID=UPI000949457A|nr:MULTISPECIES: methylated-DNA--[protein]-cysteine S-methyltransferase [unclassified Thermosipho (in: thermotogales)]ANQ54156.1 methylated-DNA-protein-cysteine methyltransferase [Thermosipho sp. 1070]APT72601.1 cysteine methyltransferase [Thermosipho sp. 1063]